MCFAQTAALQREGRAPCEKSRGHVRLGRWCRTSVVPHVGGAARLFIVRLPIASLSHAYVHIALEHNAPERVEATFCSAGRTGRIGLLVMGRLRSLGCVMLIEISASREDGARSLCVRVNQCTARGERQRDYTRHQRSTRSGEAPNRERRRA